MIWEDETKKKFIAWGIAFILSIVITVVAAVWAGMSTKLALTAWAIGSFIGTFSFFKDGE